MNNGLVSIVIPAYNASNYLADAIESALQQTYKNVEVIVVNDGSKDNGATRRVAMTYGNRIRYFEKENGGCASALNFGLEQMTGQWFSWLSHDDLYLPTKIEFLLKLIDEHELDAQRTVLGCNDLIMGPNGKMKINLFRNSVGVLPPVKAFGETLNIKTFNGCGLLIPKRIIDEVGDFRNDYIHLLDRELWMRIAVNDYSYFYTEAALVVSRVHNRQVTVNSQDSLYNEEEKLVEEYIPITKTKDGFIEELCYFSAKRQHFRLEKKIEKLLVNQGKMNLKVRTSIARWYIEGTLKKLVRKQYKKMLRRM